MYSLAWMVEITQVDISIILRHGLELRLGDENLMLVIYNHVAFIRVEVNVSTEHLGGGDGFKCTRTASNTQFDLVEL